MQSTSKHDAFMVNYGNLPFFNDDYRSSKTLKGSSNIAQQANS